MEDAGTQRLIAVAPPPTSRIGRHRPAGEPRPSGTVDYWIAPANRPASDKSSAVAASTGLPLRTRAARATLRLPVPYLPETPPNRRPRVCVTLRAWRADAATVEAHPAVTAVTANNQWVAPDAATGQQRMLPAAATTAAGYVCRLGTAATVAVAAVIFPPRSRPPRVARRLVW